MHTNNYKILKCLFIRVFTWILLDLIGAEAINHELKKELTHCQVALADCRNERDEMINELKRLHEQFESCSDASYTRVRSTPTSHHF